MTTVAEVLADQQVLVPESLVAVELRALLKRQHVLRHGSLTDSEQQFLEQFSGSRPATKRQLRSHDARAAATVVSVAASSLSRGDVAELLGVEASRVSHRVRDGQLYSYAGAGNRPRFPSWQFVDGGVVPHLREVLAHILAGTHPAIVAAFMVTPLDVLRPAGARGEAVSPLDWLVGGGNVSAVLDAAGTLGEQS